MEMNQITVSDADLRKGAEEGMDAFLKVFIDKYLEVTGGKINADTMPLLNGYQHTLLGYHFFREEVMEGGFVQLIQMDTDPISLIIRLPKRCVCLGQKISLS